MGQVEKYLDLLRAHGTTLEPKLPERLLSLSDFPDWLKASYMFEVEKRERDYHDSATSSATIDGISKWIHTRKRGLILYGPLGTGKTTAAKALYSIIKSYYKYDETIFVSSKECYQKFVDANGISDSFQSYRRAKVLFMDDVGNEPAKCLIYATPYQPIHDLLCYRYDSQKTTIITTNLDDNGLLDRYGPRLYDRFEETYDRILVCGENFRHKK